MMRFIIVHDARTPDTEIALNTAHIVTARPVTPQESELQGVATRIVTIDGTGFWVTEYYTLVKQALEAQQL